LSKLNQTGFFERVLHAVSWRLPSWLFNYDHTYLMGGRDLKLKTRDYPHYEIRQAKLTDVEIMKKAGIRESLFRHRIGRGDHCVLVLKEGRPVAWSWSATGRLFMMLGGLIIDTGEKGFFLYDVYTVPEERLKGFIMICFEKQLEHHHERGCWDIYGTISAFNVHSLKTHFRMGFETCGEAYSLTLAGVNLCYYKSWPHETRKVHVFVKRPPEQMECV
jgi:hypothetical protein